MKNAIFVFSSDSVLHKLQSQSELLLIAKKNLPHSMGTKEYRILSLQNNNWSSIYYLRKGAYTSSELPFIFSNMAIRKSKADSIINLFISTKFWTILDDDEGCKEWEYVDKRISCSSGGSMPHYEIILISNNKYLKKNYYNPVFYETKCCPGNKDRQTFIKCYNALNSF